MMWSMKAYNTVGQQSEWPVAGEPWGPITTGITYKSSREIVLFSIESQDD